MEQIPGLFFAFCGLLVVSFFPQGSQGLKCEDGWLPHEKSCYGYYPDLLTWNQAETECLSHGAESHLASFLSRMEVNAVTTGLKSKFKINEPFWIGLYDKGGGYRRWRWIDLSAVHYTRWKKGEPNNKNGNEDCVSMVYDGTDWEWNDEDCSKTYGYMCKITYP